MWPIKCINEWGHDGYDDEAHKTWGTLFLDNGICLFPMAVETTVHLFGRQKTKDLEKSRSNSCSTALPMVKCGIYQPVWISAFPILRAELHLESGHFDITLFSSPGNRFLAIAAGSKPRWGACDTGDFGSGVTLEWNIFEGKTLEHRLEMRIRPVETSMRIFSWYNQWRSIWGIQWWIDHHFLVMMLHHLWGSSRNQTRVSFFHPQFWHFCLKQSNQNGDRIQNFEWHYGGARLVTSGCMVLHGCVQLGKVGCLAAVTWRIVDLWRGVKWPMGRGYGIADSVGVGTSSWDTQKKSGRKLTSIYTEATFSLQIFRGWL